MRTPSLRFTVVACPLGRMLLAGTERGVCFLSLGDAAAELQAELAGDFPGAALVEDAAGLGPWAAEVLEHLEGRRPVLDLPLDTPGTPFQRQVWERLRAIPYGDTRTYGAIARDLGQPTAARAVARGCATNPVSVIIPCHRVVREDGGLGGYRWGLDRKRALLARERQFAPGG